jgi:hypothetical protein
MIRKEIGTIETISPQGDNIYAIIRRKGDAVFDTEGSSVYINSHIYTQDMAYTMLPDSTKSLSETLIQLDIGISIYLAKLEKLIGKEVLVSIEDGFVRYAEIIDADKSPRLISAKDIATARRLSSNISQIDSTGIEYLKQQGYTDGQITSTLSENIGNNKLNGVVIKYGDAAVYDAISKSEVSSRKNMEASSSIVTGIPASKLKNKTCHIHIKAFSAK